MKSENWSSRVGVILAVAGSAVGLGNFLKFPGQVALYGGAAFMIAYVVSFFIVGLPISVLEWTMGRYGGANGYNSAPGILGYVCSSKKMAYFGVLGVTLTLIIYCYYVYIEAWCLGYAVNFLFGNLSFSNVEESGKFFAEFIGVAENGSAMNFGIKGVLIFLFLSFLLNFWMIYRGVSRGIEFFCKYAMPALVIIGLIMVGRVLTLGNISPEHPERSVEQGLGFMWNPEKVVLERELSPGSGEWVFEKRLVGNDEIERAEKEIALKASLCDGSDPLRIRRISIWAQLADPSIWIAAAGQVFFSLTIGFGLIMTYASYLRRRDDIVLSSLTSCSANEFCEVCLGGMITVPPAVALFGVSGVVGAGLSLFDLGFKVLPVFFVSLPVGWLFGFLFFFLLYLGAVTSSLSMLQPSIAFLEEATKMRRSLATIILGAIATFLTGFVVYFSEDLKVMDTFDFWMGQVAIYVFAMVSTIVFAWKFGIDRGIKMANEGSLIKTPPGLGFVIKYLTPTFLLAIFVLWLAKDVFGIIGNGKLSVYILDLIGGPDHPVNTVSWMSVAAMVGIFVFYSLLLSRAKKYDVFKSSRRRK